MLEMNMVCATGNVFDSLSTSVTRFGFLHQAIGAFMGLMVGCHRVFVIHPCAPLAQCKSIGREADNSGLPLYRDGETALPVVSGSALDWGCDAVMFTLEGTSALGYQDRFIRRVLAPAMNAWKCRIDPDLSDADRMGGARLALEGLSDPAWRRCLRDFIDRSGS